MKRKIIRIAKLTIILFLLVAIGLVAILYFKKDLILEKALDQLEQSMADPLRFDAAHLDWVGHLPFAAIHIRNLKAGSDEFPLVEGGNLDLILRPLALLRNEVVIKYLELSNADINVNRLQGRWTYEIMADQPKESEDGRFSTSIQKLILRNCFLKFNDNDGLAMAMIIEEAGSRGDINVEHIRLDIEAKVTFDELILRGDSLVHTSLPVRLDGQYRMDHKTHEQEFRKVSAELPFVKLNFDGVIRQVDGKHRPEFKMTWSKGDVEQLTSFLPADVRTYLRDIALTGTTNGSITSKTAVGKESQYTIAAHIDNGRLQPRHPSDALNNLKVDFSYEIDGEKAKSQSEYNIDFTASLGKSPFEGSLAIEDHKPHRISGWVKGVFPAVLCNTAIDSNTLHFRKGTIDLENLELKSLDAKQFSFLKFWTTSTVDFTANDLEFDYNGTPIATGKTTITTKEGVTSIEADKFQWENVQVTGFGGQVKLDGRNVAFDLKGQLSKGAVTVQGNYQDSDYKPVFTAKWIAKGIDMQDLMASFRNFDQTFITADNISGKADIYADTRIPLDRHGNIISGELYSRSALQIRDGRLKNMKTLEDFSKFIHIEDLRDIRFSELRNYLKIENGRIYLPVMFIQSSAINLSVAGEHGFDKRIQYYIKLNAGQAISQKLKKANQPKEIRPARKNGWINMYFVLEGMTDHVQYRQYRTAVISGFEQSSRLKENLRSELVELFGYDVYWLEPNEWEEIPEFK